MEKKVERFPKWRQLIYANGYMGFSILDNIYGVYLVFFLIPPKELGMPELVDNSPLLLGITIIGIINIFGRVIDSLADPLIAWWSDNASFGIGRRKFFMLTGSIPFALSGILLFFQPVAEVSSLNALYTALMLGLFFFLYTYFMSPSLALIPELSRTSEDRISLTVYQAVFSMLGAVIVMILSPQIWSWLQAGGLALDTSFRLTMVILGLFAGVSMFVSGLPVDEKRYSASKPANVGLIESIRMTLENRLFIRYMIATILYWFAFNMIRTTVAYYPVVLLKMDQGYQMVLMGALFGTAFLVFFLLPLLSKRFDNRQLMLAGMLSFGILMSATPLIPLLGAAGVAAATLQMALIGFPVAILLVIPNAAVADLSELDGFRRGINREAMFFGTQGLFMKVNYGLALAITASLFSFFGKDAAEPMGVILTGPVGALFVLAGFFIFLKYPQAEISAELAAFRARRAGDSG
jgi:glycoside/pentoside/hexuronide:cation symporter, GPH family